MVDAETPTRKRRGGGRSGNAARRGTAVIEQSAWRIPVNTDHPTEPLPPEGVAAIHEAAMTILEEIGIEFLNVEARDILRKAGCTIEGENVRMDRDFVMEMIGRAPSQFTLTPRNPDRQITIGGNHILFGNVSSPPNYWDMELGRKLPGTREMCRNLLKLTQYFNCIHFAGGYPVEPVDIHASVRHLDVLYDKLTLSDKVMHAYSLGRERVEDVMEMVRIAGGWSHEEFEATPRMYTNINSTSPLKHDEPMLDGWMRLARRGQGLVVTPFTLAGAMAPVTMAGAVAQSLAEGLCAIALAQYINPGVPCVIGTFTSNVDMKSGAPAFGTPEYMRSTQMTGQMARFYGLPMRSSGVCAANVPDGQAVWETSNSLWAAVQSGSNMVYHAAGWLEGGLIASPEKFVMDCEVLQQIQRYFEPAIVDTSAEALALDAIRDVGPGGHFFGTQHTQDRYTTAFYQPFLSDWHNFEAWEAAGAVWTPERAHRVYKDIIGSFEPPPMDEAIRDELADFVARRKAEGGAPTDF
ncbi:trimethylamine methyltransferase family protein [Lutimaribacter sp. EGI FJ00015]|uniref:Trimethylamine methyltransferase family protein n=1 Tax=Lutimaribacter degradans TaxID=2945989 RepID=A0ACC5ZRF1_9RHOB|nr:trimethylamine methyltransferase family protein [Lutimaribacter sp. EGI FJ00013]MCM2560758.1 trimethylamine methyltransferase family protein [Lutimaribacter sp. EGI FJ00013]MCO0612296.1 trimethylamine methyltransferase family protein [Lutimaribacter sp. EGI FJ00015]MCO0634583.1 trimethylamine methyltransferase family protein [Lutimaribacter sp. EGI FJ00014]